MLCCRRNHPLRHSRSPMHMVEIEQQRREQNLTCQFTLGTATQQEYASIEELHCRRYRWINLSQHLGQNPYREALSRSPRKHHPGRRLLKALTLKNHSKMNSRHHVVCLQHEHDYSTRDVINWHDLCTVSAYRILRNSYC